VARYAIAGFRGGETIKTPHGDVRLNPNDAAAELTSDQLEFFKLGGFTTRKAADKPASEPGATSLIDPHIAAALKRAEEQAAAATAAAVKSAADARAAAHGAPVKPTPSQV
jgi:hypothetical protein